MRRCFAISILLVAVAAGAGPALSQPLQIQPGQADPAPRAATTAAPKALPRTTIPMPVPRPSGLAGGTVEGSVPRPPATVAAATPTPVAVVPADTSPRSILERANASLNAMTMLSAEFVQTGASGRRQTGRLYVQKPGRMRFEYTPPNPVEIVADGSTVAVRDRKLNTQDVYSIGQTPLKFLLKERVDLSRDTRVVDVRSEPDLASVTLEDKATFGGTSKVTLLFDAKTFALRQWIVVDPQGYETQVSLRNIDTAARIDPRLFNIDFTRVIN
ncbi:MAG: outer-membrane lipoprotein carrier protein LolA [Alsobacter sp.]